LVRTGHHAAKAAKAPKAVKAKKAAAKKAAPAKAAAHHHRPSHETAKQRKAAARKAVVTRRRRAAAAKRVAVSDLGYAACSVQAAAATLLLSSYVAGAGYVADIYNSGPAGLRRLFDAAGGDDHDGASVEAVLDAAAAVGLAGRRLAWWEPVALEDLDAAPGLVLVQADLPGPHALVRWTHHQDAPGGPPCLGPGVGNGAPRDDPGAPWAWLSWGAAWPEDAFPDMVIERAWEVCW
jgi:hypothetical protein